MPMSSYYRIFYFFKNHFEKELKEKPRLRAFDKKKKFLVVVRDRCPFLDDNEGRVFVVESENEVKRNINHSVYCAGVSVEMTREEQRTCKKCGYKRAKYIDYVEPYSYKKAVSLKVDFRPRSVKEVLEDIVF